jgi:hypothetical protein
MHDVELSELNKHAKINRWAKMKYANHPLQIRIYILLLILFTSAAAFLVATLFVGEINARELLLDKPDVMGWSGFRYTLSLGIEHWQREVYLDLINHPLQRNLLIPEKRYHYDSSEEW